MAQVLNQIVFIVMLHTLIMRIDHNFSRIDRTSNAPGRRYGWYFATMWAWIATGYLYAFYGTAFATVPKEYQWILGLLNPLVKDFSIAFQSSIAKKSTKEEGEHERNFTKFSVIHSCTTNHAVFLTIIVGNVSTPLTTNCIIFVDFALAFYSAFKIFLNKRKGKDVEGRY